MAVAPLVGARIEIRSCSLSRIRHNVAPLAGARIEISHTYIADKVKYVAPLVGARIEMLYDAFITSVESVAPLVGARIEILYWVSWYPQPLSLPSWERGLKSLLRMGCMVHRCRSPRGSAD